MSRYARHIERRWSEVLGNPVVLSRRDWSELRRWYDLGIPLEIVDEAMTAVVERDRRPAKAPRLADLARIVEEAWSAIVDGRVGEFHEAPSGPGSLERWLRRRAAEPPGSVLASLLGSLIDRFERGETAAVIDDALDRRLADTVAAELRDEAREAVERDLAPYRERISAEHLDATRRRAIVERLRRRLDLPRLAGSTCPD